MQEIYRRPLVRRVRHVVGEMARAFEVLVERQYAAPWQQPRRRRRC